jgi:hypothetical protein
MATLKKAAVTALAAGAVVTVLPGKADGTQWAAVYPYEATGRADAGSLGSPSAEWAVRYRVPHSAATWSPEFLTQRALDAYAVSSRTGGIRRWPLGNGWDVLEFRSGALARRDRGFWWWEGPWSWANEFRLRIPLPRPGQRGVQSAGQKEG